MEEIEGNRVGRMQLSDQPREHKIIQGGRRPPRDRLSSASNDDLQLLMDTLDFNWSSDFYLRPRWSWEGGEEGLWD